MKKFFIITALFCFQLIDVRAQSFNEFPTGFSLIFNSPDKTNSYYFGGNPALLDFGLKDEVLSLSSDINDEVGNFRQFTQPKTNRFYQLAASGKKSIDSTQKFKGSFAFQRFERRDWQWIFTRDYHTRNPFLLGDSTTGNTRINGILMNAEYAILLSKAFSAGLSFDYTVDEALKQVSPKPTSEHRDINARIGVNYSFLKNFNAGLILDISDKNEQISYREDEGSITRETIILKFKGYDFPNVIRKKTETRYVYTNGYKTGLTFSYDSKKIFKAAGFISFGFEKNNIKDDAVNPVSVGFWKNDLLDAGIKASSVFSDAEIYLQYVLHAENGWAKYPAFNVLYYDRKLSSNSFSAAIQYEINSSFTLGVEGGFSINSLTENDHYSAVFSEIKYNCLNMKGGSQIKMTNNISTLFAYGLFVKNQPESGLVVTTPSNYFNNYRQYDILYLQTAFMRHIFSIASQFDQIFGGTLLIYLDYELSKPKSGSVFGGEKRNNFNSTLEYRIKIF